MHSALFFSNPTGDTIDLARSGTRTHGRRHEGAIQSDSRRGVDYWTTNVPCPLPGLE